MRSLPLLPLALLLGCAPKAVPPASPPTVAAWSVDRDALPGGTLRAMEVAVTHANERVVVQGGGGTRMDLPVWVYAFEHPTQGLVLIDAGFPRRTAADVADYPGRRMANLLSLEMAPGAAAVDQLPAAGLDPGAVAHIVLTHMHADHVGGIEDFPAATVHVGAGEWEGALKGGPLGKPDTSPYLGREGVEHHSFEGSGPYGPFERHVDLFGDGSLILLEARGHTAGHMAVLLNLKGGSYLFTGDCAWIDRHWQEPVPKSALVRGLLEQDWGLNWANQQRVHVFAAAHPDVVVIGGHEVATREKLPAWPAAVE
jgi:glyoxylase-like metal-dependent hydrolase (beta-lactamase superfamily II)